MQAVHALTSIEAVYAFWEANLDSFAALPRAATDGEDPVHAIGSALKSQVRGAGAPNKSANAVSEWRLSPGRCRRAGSAVDPEREAHPR